MILFVLPAETIYDRQRRVMGWKATPPSRESLRTLKEIVPRLRELGAAKVVFSDLDSDSGKLLARRLNVPYEEWTTLRRFNAGKSHGVSIKVWLDLMGEMDKVWLDKPDVPVKGGDSKTSFAKRVAALEEKLKGLTNAVVVADPQLIQGIVKAEVKLERGRVYAWEAPANGSAAQTV